MAGDTWSGMAGGGEGERGTEEDAPGMLSSWKGKQGSGQGFRRLPKGPEGRRRGCVAVWRLTWLTMRSPESDPPPPPPPPRGLAMESISSKKRMHGAAPRALSKSWRTFDSDSPNHMERSSGPLTEMKLDLASLAIA